MQNGSRVAPRQPFRPTYQPKRLHNSPEEQSAGQKNKKSLLRFLMELAAAGLAVYLLFGVVFGIAVINGDSMSPSIPAHSLIFFLRLDTSPQTGDVVIFTASSDKKLLIKRVVAVSGDVVNLDSGTLTVNGTSESGTYAVGTTNPVGSSLEYPFTVPVESIFVLGDNRENSIDSRQLGAINTRRLVGVALLELKLP
ncbi:MAG: hypothetical protein H6Q60_478 [Oscillospiraceae bacterium]|nr:hypothetical protein [Oscillospiraceae bacterium]